MNRLLRLLFVAILVCSATVVFAQGTGIKGNLVDEKGEAIVNANVEVSSGGMVNGRDVTDLDGNYTVKPLNGGRYTVKFTYLGKERIYTDVSVAADQIVTVNGKISTSTELKEAKITSSRYVVPIINPENPGGRSIKTAEQIEKTATRNASDIAALSTQVYQGGSGQGLSIGGGRGTNTKYVIDGVQLNPGAANFTNQAPNSVEAITTFSSGVPARYGDATGGLVSITTKGASARTQGNIQYEHSLEGYNQNQLTMNLSGPLYRKKDSATGAYRPIIGYNVTADGIFSSDQNPVYGDNDYTKEEVLSALEAHPLTTNQVNGINTIEYAANLVHSDAFEKKKRQVNSEYYRGQLGGKLDFNLTNNIQLRVGGNYFYLDAPSYSRGASLLAPDGFNRSNSQTGRGYVRFTQKFGNRASTDKLEDNTITNAFYTVQVDYSKDYTTTQNKDKKHSTFDYGYIGKYQENYAPAYQPGGIDDSTGKVGIKLVGYAPTGVNFTPGTQNPGLANYTKDFYSFVPNPTSQNDIIAGRGLRNGDNPPSVYGLFSNVGATGTGWSKSNTDQVAFQVDASFDIKHKKTTHSVEFGLYYQQRNTRSYSINGSYLWTLMRQITSRVVNQEVDTRYATFIVDGVKYSWEDVNNGVISPGPNDTILYARKFDTTAQTAFDRHLREKLYGNRYSTEYINTDVYDPNFYSLDMFSADDLLNGGQNRPVSYFGYDYMGNAVTGTVNFNDFWTQRNAEGDYTRPIGAYRPNYMAGYISDYIQYKDFRITLGARIERFDNNTKVLKDPYSFYATQTAGQVGGHPSNIGDDFVVYVGNNTVSNSATIGYRNGDTWYDAQGREVADPRVLQTETGSQNVQPKLQNPNERMTDVNYNPDQSFEDYTPQVNVMPRINFSFPLNENALFYAHYDIMYQRPNVGAFATQTDYMFIEQNPSAVYGNSNLKPERAIDYEVGFQQRLTDNSGVTLSGFYKERKDQIQIRRYVYAFPITYLTYGNRDYSTYKGLSLNYDLRRVGNFSMNVNYTLSFTEGTGSNAASGINSLAQLVAAGLPNLRTQFPVDYDSRHNINAQFDYRFRPGGGPVVGNSHILENFGVNLVFRARSGEPYTKYANPQNLQSGASNSAVIDGTVNGSRLGYHYNFDLNIDKTIPLNLRKSRESGKPNYMSLNIYAYAKNLFNYRDVVNVYGYTGRPDDDGFLASPQGATVIASQVDATAFTSYYNMAMMSPYNYGAPRTILVGLRLNF